MTDADGIDVGSCERCSALVRSRSRIVNGVGDADADLVFVGEAPGQREDDLGEPFVGRSGDLLTEKLDDLGVAREDVRITNSVRCRPPENRDPRKKELANCRSYLHREISAVDPEAVCTLGRVPTGNLLGGSFKMADVVGDVRELKIETDVYPLVPCYHPAAMLYDRSKEDRFEQVLEKAAILAGYL